MSDNYLLMDNPQMNYMPMGQFGHQMNMNAPGLHHQRSSGNILEMELGQVPPGPAPGPGSMPGSMATPNSIPTPGLSAPLMAANPQPQTQPMQPQNGPMQPQNAMQPQPQPQMSGQGGQPGQAGPAPTQTGSNQAVSGPVSGQVPGQTGLERFTLKISNLPHDLSSREATLIFSLVIDDILKIEVNNSDSSPIILAFFKTFNTCITTFKLLNQKCIFGNDVPIQVEIDESLSYEFNSMAITPHSGSVSGGLSGRSRFSFNDPFQDMELGPGQGGSGPGQTPGQTPGQGPAVSAPGSTDANSGPQTPLNNLNFDWNQNPASLASKNNRRTSSAFFQSNFSNNLLNNSFLNSNLPQMNQPLINQLPQRQPTSGPSLGPSSGPPSALALALAQPQALAPGQSLAQAAQGQTLAQAQTLAAQGQSQAGQAQPLAPALAPALAQGQSQGQSQGSPEHSPEPTLASQIQDPPEPTTDSNVTSPVQQVSGSFRKDVPDLSLLARVPPPANPADQNPPCNTLYVGNLPPDATEQELRALFSPQKGFRRLSFRTKTNSSNPGSNNHGPMCFVEFEDVAHATRALAELYGRILPRSSSSNGKGGIRLSFSKNPLGVRGPQRRSSSNQVNGGYGYNYQR